MPLVRSLREPLTTDYNYRLLTTDLLSTLMLIGSFSVTNAWTPKDTTTHQDHVIAHVVDATFLGYFTFDEALYVLLDIGFIWTIFLDGEMGLLPHPVAVSELEINQAAKEQIKTDIDVLLGDGDAENLLLLQPPPVLCQIKDVSFYAADDSRRLLVAGEPGSIVIETSLATAEIVVKDFLNWEL